jgi:hypothetical protein
VLSKDAQTIALLSLLTSKHFPTLFPIRVGLVCNERVQRRLATWLLWHWTFYVCVSHDWLVDTIQLSRRLLNSSLKGHYIICLLVLCWCNLCRAISLDSNPQVFRWNRSCPQAARAPSLQAYIYRQLLDLGRPGTLIGTLCFPILLDGTDKIVPWIDSPYSMPFIRCIDW